MAEISENLATALVRLRQNEIDIANAIRRKKGTTAKIFPKNFASEIASISSGGSKPTVVYDRPFNNIY